MIEARLAEIRGLLESPEADLDALEAEVTQLETERSAINAATEQRARLVASVVGAPASQILRSFPAVGAEAAAAEEREYDSESPEYRTAFLKNLAHRTTGEWRLGELSAVEQRAYTNTTTNQADVLPVTMSTRIWDLIGEKYAVINDISWATFANVYEFVQNDALADGDPDVTTENIAGEELELSFNPVTLTGKEIKATVKLSRKMQIQSMNGFEDYLVRKLADRIGIRMNKLVITAIQDDILNGNKLTPSTLDESDFRELFGGLLGASTIIVYANQSTVWNEIAGLTDEEGRRLFIESELSSDPTIQGRIYGKTVKVDNTLADGLIVAGDPAAVEANMFAALEMATAQDILGGTFEIVHAAYTLFDAALGDTRAWGQIDITSVS